MVAQGEAEPALVGAARAVAGQALVLVRAAGAPHRGGEVGDQEAVDLAGGGELGEQPGGEALERGLVLAGLEQVDPGGEAVGQRVARGAGLAGLGARAARAGAVAAGALGAGGDGIGPVSIGAGGNSWPWRARRSRIDARNNSIDGEDMASGGAARLRPDASKCGGRFRCGWRMLRAQL